MTTEQTSGIRTAMANVDREFARTPTPTRITPTADAEHAKAQQVAKIKHRPTERLAAYHRNAEKMIDEAREELIGMEAEHALILDGIATEGQAKINAKRDELKRFEDEVARCREELSMLESKGKAEVENAAAEYNRQRQAQEAIIQSYQALKESLNSPIKATKIGG